MHSRLKHPLPASLVDHLRQSLSERFDRVTLLDNCLEPLLLLSGHHRFLGRRSLDGLVNLLRRGDRPAGGVDPEDDRPDRGW